MFKFKTIHHYGIAFFWSEYALNSASMEVDNIFFQGEISKLSREKARLIAEIHPNCIKYYEQAMMPLFKGYGRFSSGTENPVLAIESLKTKKESEIDLPYILIWRIFNPK